MHIFKNLWKHSRLRFYWLNAQWNYKFWLYAKRIYKGVDYFKGTGDYIESTQPPFNAIEKKERITKKRFAGFFYKTGIYWDNPGLKIDDRETWEVWRRKGLI